MPVDDRPSGDRQTPQRPAPGELPRPYAGLFTGWVLALAVLFALFGAAQVALAAFFLARGDPAFVIPAQQPQEGWSITVGGWLPLGACGLVMLALAWVTMRVRRLIRGDG